MPASFLKAIKRFINVKYHFNTDDSLQTFVFIGNIFTILEEVPKWAELEEESFGNI